MPRTRIRAKAPLIVNTGGGGVTDGSNPAGSSLTVDSVGSIDITGNDNAAVPTELLSFTLNVTSADTVLSPAEADQFLAIMDSGTDTVTTPDGAHSTQVQAGATGVGQTSSVGTGWTNTGNAVGLPNGTNATINAPAAVGGATQGGTLVGSYTTVLTGTPVETQTGTITLAFTGQVTIGALATGSCQISYSIDSGANYTVLATRTATAALGSFTITGITLATLSNLRFRLVNSHTPSATGASGTTLDAVVATFTTTGNNAG